MLLALVLVLGLQAPHGAAEPPAQWLVRVSLDGVSSAAGVRVRAAYSTWFRAEAREPLPDAVVGADGIARVDLSALGLRSTIELAEGSLEAFVHHPGFSGELVAARIQALTRQGARGMTSLHLKAGRELAGRVLDPSGRPVHLARVGVWRWGEDLGDHPSTRISTDGTGTFALPLEQPAGLTIVAFHPSFGSARADVQPDELSPVLVLAALHAPVRGRVVGFDGTPLPEGQVRAVSTTQGRQRLVSRFLGRSDARGELELHLPDASPWKLGPWPSFPHAEAPLVTPGSEGVTVRQPGHHFAVELLDEFARPIHGVVQLVRVIPSGAGWGVAPDEQATGVRGELGTFARSGELGLAVGDISPDTYAVRAIARTLDGVGFEAEALLPVEQQRSLTRLTLTLREQGPRVPLAITVRGRGDELVPAWRGLVLSARTGFPVLTLTDRGVPLYSCMATTYHDARIAPGEYVLQLETRADAVPSRTPFRVYPSVPVHLDVYATDLVDPRGQGSPATRR